MDTLLDAFGSPDVLLRAGLDWGIKGALLLTATITCYVCMRKTSAARRHVVLALSLTALLLLPVLSWLLPGVALPVLPAASIPAPALANKAPDLHTATAPPPAITDSASAIHNAPARPSGAPLPIPSVSKSEVVKPRSRAVGWANMLIIVWAMGALLTGLPTLAGLVFVQLRSLRACRVGGPLWMSLLDEAKQRLGLFRKVTLLQGKSQDIPVTWGCFRPVVLLPAEADDWTDERKRVVLLHELGHIKRHDFIIQCVACLARALHWFNPLAWIAARALCTESERACDDLVLSTGMRASTYAEHLLALCRSLRACPSMSLAAIAMARRARIDGRVRAILDDRLSRRTFTRRVLATTLAVALAAVLGIALVRPVARAQEPQIAAVPDAKADSAPPSRRDRSNLLKQMGLVFKMYANETRGEKFPSVSPASGAFFPETAQIYPEFLTSRPLLDYLMSKRGIDLCYLGHTVQDEATGLALLKAHRERGREMVRNDDVELGSTVNPLFPVCYRLREGVERFFITDINDPAAGARTQSQIPVLWEMPDTLDENGGYVLYMDGHVEYEEYPGEFPMTKPFITALRGLMDHPPIEADKAARDRRKEEEAEKRRRHEARLQEMEEREKAERRELEQLCAEAEKLKAVVTAENAAVRRAGLKLVDILELGGAAVAFIEVRPDPKGGPVLLGVRCGEAVYDFEVDEIAAAGHKILLTDAAAEKVVRVSLTEPATPLSDRARLQARLRGEALVREQRRTRHTIERAQMERQRFHKEQEERRRRAEERAEAAARAAAATAGRARRVPAATAP